MEELSVLMSKAQVLARPVLAPPGGRLEKKSMISPLSFKDVKLGS